MMLCDFSSHRMFCLSTGNQTVNLVPALQFGIKRAKIFSTEYAETKGLTRRLKKVMEARGIQVDEPVLISHAEEKSMEALVDRLIEEARPHPKIVWNISGGQKLPTIALHTAFHNRSQAGFRDDQVLYLEAKPPETWWFGADSKMYSIRSSCDISLDEVLFLYDSIADEKVAIYPKTEAKYSDFLRIADRALEYYLSDDLFREAFFACMKPGFHSPASKNEMDEVMRKALNAVKADLNSLSLDIKDYNNFVDRIQEISTVVCLPNHAQRLKNALDRIKIIHKPEEIYKSYWNEIRKRSIDKALMEIEADRVQLNANPIKDTDFKRLREQLESMGGEIRGDVTSVVYRDSIKFSAIGPNSALFEWMVAAAVMRAIGENPKIKENISEVHLQCKTKSASDFSAKHDAELDLVVTTRFGTLIILEVKTYDFSGDTAKGKDHSAYRKSGPYGRAVMVGPLIRSFITRDSACREPYPPYIDGKIQEQKRTAEQNGISYSYLDGLQQLLEKELAVSSE